MNYHKPFINLWDLLMMRQYLNTSIKERKQRILEVKIEKHHFGENKIYTDPNKCVNNIVNNYNYTHIDN